MRAASIAFGLGSAMRREIFSEEHELFRAQFRRFVKAEVEPNVAGVERGGHHAARDLEADGRGGLPRREPAREYGGAGRATSSTTRSSWRSSPTHRAHALQASLHTDICLPYLTSYGTEEQKRRWLVPGIAGDCLLAIAHDRAAAPAPTSRPCRRGDPRRRPLRRERREDLHLERPELRPRDRGGEDRSRRSATTASACCSSRRGRRASSAGASSRRSASRGRTPARCPSRTAACPSRTCSARKGRASSC